MADLPDAEEHLFELDELANQPGTYFNPQTEVVVIVDDSASVDQEIFDMDSFEGAEWVRITDDVPVDEGALDEALENFQAQYHPGSGPGRADDAELERGNSGDDPEDEDGDDPEPDKPEN